MLPPPALTVSIRTAGRATTSPATLPPPSPRGVPPVTRLASALVPPMSSVNRSRSPTAAPTSRAPTTPPAGPDSASDAARVAAAPGGSVPPLDVMTRSSPMPRARTSRSSRPRYAETLGRRYASTVVVLVRSNARNTGSTWWLATTGTSGRASRSAATRRRSCSAWRNANSKATASASGASARTAATTRTTSSSPSGSSTPSLEEGVRSDRGSVNQDIDRDRRQGVQRSKQPDRGIVRRGHDLPDLDRPVFREGDEIGEGSTHIHAHPHDPTTPCPTSTRNTEDGTRNRSGGVRSRTRGSVNELG